MAETSHITNHTQWIQMRSNTALRKSRDSWQQKAVRRSKSLKSANRKLTRSRRKVALLEQQRNSLQSEILNRERIARDSSIAKPQTISLGDAHLIRALCVLLAIVAVVSFRSVPRILKLMRSTAGIELDWIPHFTSVINWTLRLGLARLSNVAPIADRWVAIIDCTIDVGVKKALVVLRVKLSALTERGTALTLSDCECVGLEVSESWVGESVCEALARIFALSGRPTAILKDGAGDLNLGVRLWRDRSKAKSVIVIDDVGHAMANALKKMYAKKNAFLSFLKSIRHGATKLRQSDLAFLSPPKIRTKGRFQSIERVASWGIKILDLLGGKGRQAQNSIADRLRTFLPKFGSHRKFLEEFAFSATVANEFNQLLKKHGLNRHTYRLALGLLEKMPVRSKVRTKMTKWLRKHLQRQCRLGLGQTPLPVSSDVIESLFGKFKILLQRNPKAELNRIALAIPSLCGRLSETEINLALAKTSHTELLNWEKCHVQTSMTRQRRVHLSNTQNDKKRCKVLPVA